MFFTNSDGCNIYYDIKEDGKQPVVFLHAWGSSHIDFKYTFENLNGFKKIVYDHRGFGMSDKQNRNMSLGLLAKDLKEIIDFLKLEDVIIVGYSMGASVLYKYIQNYGTDNIKAIVICDMTPKAVSDESWNLGIMDGEFKARDFMESIANQFENMIDAYYKLYTKVDPELKNHRKEVVNRAIEADLSGNSYYSITSMWFSICYEDFRDTVKMIDIPTALFFATPGSLVNPNTVNYLVDNIKNTYVHMFENSSHSFVNYKPKYFTNELYKFLQYVQNI